MLDNYLNSLSDIPISDIKIDKIDIDVIKLLLLEKSNKAISSTMNLPISTVQRRIRKIVDQDIVISQNRLNHSRLGYRTGLFLIYLSFGNIQDIAQKVLGLYGIISVEIHIGDSDIIADYVYKDGNDLLDIVTQIKKMEGVERVIWSERVSKISANNDVTTKL